MTIDVLNKDGQVSGQIELNDNIFGIEPNEDAMHHAVVSYLAHQRQGTHKTKLRSEVSGGNKKPWRQKGRGTARAGSTRSPIWVGGGTIHGPKPHDYVYKVNRKVKKLAKRSALSARFAENNLVVVEDFQLSDIKTASVAQMLGKLNLKNEKTLVLLSGPDQNFYLSGRNIPNLTINTADKISTYDILSHKKLLIFKAAVGTIEESLSN